MTSRLAVSSSLLSRMLWFCFTPATATLSMDSCLVPAEHESLNLNSDSTSPCSICVTTAALTAEGLDNSTGSRLLRSSSSKFLCLSASCLPVFCLRSCSAFKEVVCDRARRIFAFKFDGALEEFVLKLNVALLSLFVTVEVLAVLVLAEVEGLEAPNGFFVGSFGVILVTAAMGLESIDLSLVAPRKVDMIYEESTRRRFLSGNLISKDVGQPDPNASMRVRCRILL